MYMEQNIYKYKLYSKKIRYLYNNTAESRSNTEVNMQQRIYPYAYIDTLFFHSTPNSHYIKGHQLE